MERTISHFTHQKHVIHVAVLLLSGAAASHLPAQVTVDSSAQADSLAATNGNKFAAGASGLHTVYGKAGAIYYSWSANGQTWSPPLALTGIGIGAWQPAIDVASDGTVGVVYQLNGSLSYLSCKPALGNAPCVAWKAPLLVGFGSHPSLIAFQTDMYLAAAAGGIVTYTKFAAATGVVNGGLEYAFYDSSTCYQHKVDFPAVTVTPQPGGQPEIRVSWLQSSTNGTCNGWPKNYVGMFSAKRQPGGSWATPDFWSYTANTVAADIYSLSAAQNASTGELFVAASWMANNAKATVLFRRSQAGTWYTSPQSTQASLIDIATDGTQCNPRIRIAYTVPVPGTSYGNTYYQTGAWTGAAAAPSWSGAPVLVDSVGTSPQALFWSALYFGSGFSLYTYSTPVLYARQVWNGESVQIQSIKTAGGDAQQCLPPYPNPPFEPSW
jgi:hypothetical protein